MIVRNGMLSLISCGEIKGGRFGGYSSMATWFSTQKIRLLMGLRSESNGNLPI